MSCKSKVGTTIYIAKCGAKKIIGQVTVKSCTKITYEQRNGLIAQNIVGHCPTQNLGDRYFWEFTDAKQFEQPITYSHPRGAQIWVKLP